jgi:hypothetical protein
MGAYSLLLLKKATLELVKMPEPRQVKYHPDRYTIIIVRTDEVEWARGKEGWKWKWE